MISRPNTRGQQHCSIDWVFIYLLYGFNTEFMPKEWSFSAVSNDYYNVAMTGLEFYLRCFPWKTIMPCVIRSAAATRFPLGILSHSLPAYLSRRHQNVTRSGWTACASDLDISLRATLKLCRALSCWIMRHDFCSFAVYAFQRTFPALRQRKVWNRPLWSHGWFTRWPSLSSTRWSHGRVSSACVENRTTSSRSQPLTKMPQL